MHLATIDRKYHSLIRQTIGERLRFDPEVETRSRKPVKKKPTAIEADWELRFGPNNRFRVLYIVDAQQRNVIVTAIGVKDRDVLLVGREAIDL